MSETAVTMAHGAGGRQTARLIRDIFAAAFANPDLTCDDAAIISLDTPHGAFTTDGFIVSPWEFPGGNIGKLSICGTVNDLACMGAKPKYLTCAFQIEEGCPIADLQKIAAAMAATAQEAGVRIVAGDTKVAGRGQVDHCFITTAGIGEIIPGVKTSGAFARPGNAVIVSGDIGRHGAAILLARNDFSLDADVASDCAPLWNIVEAALAVTKDIHVIRDATRGGVGTVLYEIAAESNVGIRLESSKLPIIPAVGGLCRMLGLDPLYLACEGRMVMISPPEYAEKIVAALRQTKHGETAAIIGRVTDDHAGQVTLATEIGTITMLPQPGGELLPRIC